MASNEEPEWSKRAREQAEKERAEQRQAAKDAYDEIVANEPKPKPKN